MPSVTIPLAGVLNTRKQTQLVDSVGKVDQLFRNCDFDVIKNPITGDAKMFIQKRWGLASYISTGASAVANAGFLVSVTGTIISAFGASAGTVYADSTNCGVSGQKVLHISEASISGKQHYFITCSDGSGWYLVSDSYSQTAYTGNRTSGSPIINGIASTAGMYAGQAIAGDAGIPANTRILTVDSGSQITLSANATSGAATSTALTKTPLAKIVSLPGSAVGKFVYLDGYLFFADETNKRIYQSGLNNITSWGASDYITVQSSGEAIAGIARVGSRLAALCSASIEFFYNAGNPSGSVLTSQKELFRRIGVSGGSATNASSTVPVYAYSGDTVFFLGTEGGQSRGIYAMAGTEIKKISTPEIDRQISRSAAGTYWLISAFHDRGKNYVVVSETSSPLRNFIGCLENGMWTDAYFFSDTIGGWTIFGGGIVGYTGSNTTDTSMVFCVNSRGTDGVVYRLRNDIYTDNGTAFTLSCQTSKTDFGSEKLKTIKNVALLGADIQPAVKYLSLDGSGSATTPDSASVSPTGDIELIVKIAADDYTPSSQQRIAGHHQSLSDQRGFYLDLQTGGFLQFSSSTTGLTDRNDVSTVALSTVVSNGATIFVKVNIDIDNGAAGHDVNFYYSTDGINYTKLGATVTSAGTGSIYDANTPFSVGANAFLGLGFTGDIYYAELRDGIDGPTLAKFDPQASATAGASTFTSTTGEVWTMNGTGVIVQNAGDTSVATLEYSDDDYNSWTTAGTFDLTKSNPRIYRCGSFKGGRAWRLTHSANTAFRAQALKFEYEEGAH